MILRSEQGAKSCDNSHLHLVVDATRLAGVARSGLQGDAGGAVGGQLEEEGVGVVP